MLGSEGVHPDGAFGPNAGGDNRDMYTPLHMAVIFDNKDVVSLLLSHGADPNIGHTCSDLSGEAPLHDAKSVAVCRLLLNAGGRVNTRACGGNTPLMMAAAAGRELIAKMLLGAGADPTIFDTEGLSSQLTGRGPRMGETAAKTARRCGHGSLSGLLDAAEAEAAKEGRWTLISCAYCGLECGQNPTYRTCAECDAESKWFLCNQPGGGGPTTSCHDQVAAQEGLKAVVRKCKHECEMVVVSTAGTPAAAADTPDEPAADAAEEGGAAKPGANAPAEPAAAVLKPAAELETAGADAGQKRRSPRGGEDASKKNKTA